MFPEYIILAKSFRLYLNGCQNDLILSTISSTFREKLENSLKMEVMLGKTEEDHYKQIYIIISSWKIKNSILET